ncbi:MAG: AMP-binding protein [Candidatus Baltobacteraceae bacterium]
MTTRSTAYVDTFAQERLPLPEAMPEVRCEGVTLAYPQRINAAAMLLDRHAGGENGDRRCVLAPGLEWTYRNLQHAANRIAGVLVEDLGLEPGNRVLLLAPNTPMLAACWFGVLKAGGIAVTAMPLYRAGELRFIMEKAQVKHALCDARLRAELDRACQEYGGVRAAYFGGDPNGDPLEAKMGRKSERFENVETYAEDVALVAFTSGTTGTPKAAMHFHRDLLATCDTYGARVLQPRRDDLFCGSPPLAFTFGLGGLLLFPLWAGAATLLLEKAGPNELLDAIGRYGVTTLFTAPIAYRAMATASEARDLSTLRTCVSAGEPLPKAVWEGWRARTGVKILDGIGSTEMLHIFVGSPEGDVRAGSTGRAVPGYVAEVHDDDGRPLPDGTIGRLAVKGPTGCKYLQDERQAIYVQNGWNYPGDAYRRDAEGYFWYVARTDDMIVSAGYNISGPEVEQALIAHADVKEVAVVGKADRQKETHFVKAFIVLADGCDPNDAKAEELREFCKAQIAPFKAPREIEFVAELPRTQTGKLQRYKLRELA